MKYTHGADRRQGSHLTDLIGDGPTFWKVLRIVFTLFFFVSIGLPVPRFFGPDGSAAEPCFLFLLGSQYPVSPGPMVRLYACWKGMVPSVRSEGGGAKSKTKLV